MDYHHADATEQAAWRATGEQPSHYLVFRGTMARSLPDKYRPYTTCYIASLAGDERVCGRIMGRIGSLVTQHNGLDGRAPHMKRLIALRRQVGRGGVHHHALNRRHIEGRVNRVARDTAAEPLVAIGG